MATPHRHHYGALVMGLVLVTLGLFLMVDQYLRIDLWNYLWPFVISCIGLLFFAGMVSYGKEAGALAIPGCVCVSLGLVGFIQAVFNHWEGWAYAWSLVAPTSVGIGLIIFGWWSERPKLRRAGLIVTLVGLLLFITLGATFELLFAWSGTASPGRFLLPLVIIAVGLALVFGRNPLRRFVSAVVGDSASSEDWFRENQPAAYTGSDPAGVQQEPPQVERVVAPEDADKR